MMRLLPPTYEEDWRPTPLWIMSRLAFYAIAALSGAAVIVILVGLYALFDAYPEPPCPLSMTSFDGMCVYAYPRGAR